MRRLICSLALVCAAPAWADPVAPEPAASPAATGQELIAQASAEDLFELLPAERLIVVRHTRSGLVCRMDPGDGNRLVVFPQAARGEDIACDSTDGSESLTLYATRFSFDTTLQEQTEGAEAAIRHRFPDARPYSGAQEPPDSSLPPWRTIEYLVTRQDGARMYTRASVALVNGWAIKLRYSLVAPDDATVRQGHSISEAAWRGALVEIVAPPRT